MIPNLSYFKTRIGDYPQAETLSAFWLTDASAVAEMLPKPLEPFSMPLVMAFVARFPEVSFGTPYLMGGLFLFCVYRGEVGTYVPNIVESDDFPVFMGREVLGYPKKMGVLGLDVSDSRASGFIERRGVRLLDLNVEFGTLPTNEKAQALLSAFGFSGERPPGEVPVTEGINFLFKFSHSAEVGRMFEHPPRIVRQPTTMRTRSLQLGNFDISLGVSPSDSPWSRFPVREKLFAQRTLSHNTMNPPTVLADIEDEVAFLPHSFLKYEA